MNRRRVKIARDFLQTLKVPKKKFNMAEWGHYENGEIPDVLTEGHLRGGCNTSACAAGWLTTKFKNLSLLFVDFEYEIVFNENIDSLASLQEFFGFKSEKPIEFLFVPFEYKIPTKITPKMVAKRLDWLLNHGEDKLLLCLASYYKSHYTASLKTLSDLNKELKRIK